MNKEQAKANLISLINACVKIGGVFNDASSVGAMVESVRVLGLDEDTTLTVPFVKPASEQIADRINGKK